MGGTKIHGLMSMSSHGIHNLVREATDTILDQPGLVSTEQFDLAPLRFSEHKEKYRN